MIVVSDTTPIIALLKTGHLELLQLLFKSVLIPEAVFNELTTNQSYKEEAGQIRKCSYIQVEQVESQKTVDIFRRATGLDAGESEAIVLADERQAELLLMDEHKGRRVAKQMGLSITGTVGILIHAYDEQYLTKDAVIDCLNKMKEGGIRISEALYDIVLKHIG